MPFEGHSSNRQHATPTTRRLKDRPVGLLLVLACLMPGSWVYASAMRKVEPSHITSTAAIEGWTIRSYLGPVVAHSVSGAGLVTEFLAGLTDVFGGKSAAIRNRLNEVSAAAFEDLAREASRLGGNWVVGVRVDVGEVSGKGTMMFMVTVSGTAVVAESHIATVTQGVPSGVTADVLRREQKRRRVASITDLELHQTPSDMQSIIDLRVVELAPVFLSWLRQCQEGPYEHVYAERLSSALAYFGALAPDDAAGAIYANVVPAARAPRMCETDLLIRLDLLDYEKTYALLVSDEPRMRWCGVQTLRAHRGVVARTDLEWMDRCCDALRIPYPLAPLTEVKRLLGRRQVWTCACGQESDAAVQNCEHCRRDRRGFRHDDLTPEAAVTDLQELRSIVASALLQEPNAQA